MSRELPEEVDKGIALYESGDTEAAKAHWRTLLRGDEEVSSLAVECITLVDNAGDESIDLRAALEAEDDDELGWGDLLDNVGDLSGFGVADQDLDLDELAQDSFDLDDSIEVLDEEHSHEDTQDDSEDEDPLARLSLLEDLPPEAAAEEDDLLDSHPMVDDDGELVDDLFAELTNEDLSGRKGLADSLFDSDDSDELDVGLDEVPLADDPLADDPLADDPLADDPLADDPLADDPLADDPLAEGLDNDQDEDPLGPDPLADVSLGRSIPTDANSSMLPDLHSGQTAARAPVSDGDDADFLANQEQTGKRQTDGSATPSPSAVQQRSDPLARFFEDEDSPAATPPPTAEDVEQKKDPNDETNPQTPSSRAPVKGLDKLLQQDSPEDSDVSIGPMHAPPPLTAPSPKHHAAESSDGFFGSFFGEQPEEEQVPEEEAEPGEPAPDDSADPLSALSRPKPKELSVDRPVSPFELDLLPPEDDEELDDLDALQQLFDEASSLVDSAPTEEDDRVHPMPDRVARPSTPAGTPRPVDLERSRIGEPDSPTPAKPLASEEFNRQLTPAHTAGSFDRTETGDLPNAAGYSRCQEFLQNGDIFKAWAHAAELRKEDKSPELAELAEALHERLLGMAVELIKPLDRNPVLAIAPSEITQLPGLDHRAGYLLSQIDGTVPIEFLIDLGAMPREEAALVILTLEERGIIDL